MATKKKVVRKSSVSTSTRTKPLEKTSATQPVTAEDQIHRTYKGKDLVIDVVDGQFIFEGQTFKSLSTLAKSIVGYGISGPHFFRMTMPQPGKLTEDK